MCIHIYTYIYMGRKTDDRQTDCRTHKQTDRKMDIETDRQTSRETEGQLERCSYKQTLCERSRESDKRDRKCMYASCMHTHTLLQNTCRQMHICLLLLLKNAYAHMHTHAGSPCSSIDERRTQHLFRCFPTCIITHVCDIYDFVLIYILYLV